MDDIRSSFSRFKKDIKRRLGRKKHAPDRVGANPTEGRADSLDSALRLDHRASAGCHGEEGTRTSTDVLQARSSERSPQPEPTPTGKGSDDQQRREADVLQARSRERSHQPEPTLTDEGNDDPQRKEADVGEKEASQKHPHPDPDTQVAGGSGPNRGACSPQPSPPLPNKAEPEGA